MSFRRRIGATFLTAAAAVAPPRAGRASYAAEQVPASPEISQILQRDLQQLTGRLNDPVARQEDRDEAARRLISRQTPEARRIVAEALVAPNAGGQLAAARALADDAQPDEAMINPLFAAMGTNRALTEACARALANYQSHPQVVARMIDFVQRRPPSESARIAVVRALGALADKRAAEFLVVTVGNADESPGVRGAAADALAEMSGAAENGQDAGPWQQWWAANSSRSEEQFRAEVQSRKSARYDQLRHRMGDLSGELEKIINEQYRLAPTAQRADVLLNFLRSTQPEVRAIAAGIVKYEALANNPPMPPVREQLRDMIGDSSPAVRAATADALATINDPDALEPLMAQLAQESDPAVRANIALALWPINDIRPTESLLAMLNDPSAVAAGAAAEALKQLGPKILETNPMLAQRTARELRDTLERRAAAPDASDFREKLIAAMVPLKQQELSDTFKRLLDLRRGEGPGVRRLALRGLGELANPQSIDLLVAALDDRSELVRLEAVQALAKNPALPERAETLRRLLDPQQERDDGVRQAAWNALQGVFPMLPKAQLQVWADRFKDDPSKRVLAFRALADQQLKDSDEDGLATTRESIGATYETLGVNDKAAEFYGLALEYKKGHGATPAVIEKLTLARLRALLSAKDYANAIAFAGQVVAEDPANQQTVGPPIWNQVNHLHDSGDFPAALELIAQARRMNPPLAERTLERLREFEQDIQRKAREKNPTGPGTGPQSAVTGAGPTSSTAASGP